MRSCPESLRGLEDCHSQKLFSEWSALDEMESPDCGVKESGKREGGRQVGRGRVGEIRRQRERCEGEGVSLLYKLSSKVQLATGHWSLKGVM